jgi:hypothetical protein
LKAVYGNRLFDADIINILSDADVSGIAYDTIFATEGDEALIEATARANNLYYPVILAPIDYPAELRVDDDKVLRKIYGI